MTIKYNHFWIGKIKWVVVFIIVVPFISFWSFPFREITMTYVNATETHYMYYMKPSPIPWPSPTTILGACVMITCIGCFFCNVYVGFTLYQRINTRIDLNYQQDKVYFFLMMCNFVNQVFSCVTEVILVFLQLNR